MLSYSFGPQLERPTSGARSPRTCEVQNRSFSFGVQNPTLIFFKFSHKLPRASGAWRHLHLVTQYRLGLLWHLSDTSIRSRAPALTPASILHPNNPCAEPKGSQPNQTQRHEPKSLGYFITYLSNHIKIICYRWWQIIFLNYCAAPPYVELSNKIFSNTISTK